MYEESSRSTFYRFISAIEVLVWVHIIFMFLLDHGMVILMSEYDSWLVE
jgi:hypothetical protein